jgi:regulator of sigma E protease
VTVARGAEQLSVTLSREQWTAIMQRPAYLFAHPAHVGAVVPNGPADKAGIRARDTFISIDGEPVDDWNEMRSIIGKSANRELTVVVRRWQAGEETLALTPWESASTRGRGEIRISPGNPDFRIVKKTFSEAVAEAPSLVLLNIGRYVENVKALITRIVTRLNVKEAHRELSGPVGIAQVAARAANEGMDAWLRFIVMFNIALGVMNALPLPVLDGGHIVFAAYEGIFRRPLAPRIFVPVMNGAIIAFLCFFVLITLSDVVKIAK